MRPCGGCDAGSIPAGSTKPFLKYLSMPDLTFLLTRDTIRTMKMLKTSPDNLEIKTGKKSLNIRLFLVLAILAGVAILAPLPSFLPVMSNSTAEALTRTRPVSRPGVPITPTDGTGCIYIVKEIFDTLGQPLDRTRVAQFEFTMNGLIVRNDSNGNAGYEGLAPGWYNVVETPQDGWAQTSATANGYIEVFPNKCTTIYFKNRQTTPVIPPALTTTCTVSPSIAYIGNTVTWKAFASGGTSSTYTYSWSGAVSGDGNTRSTSFDSIGTKTATVTVTSGGKSISKSCSRIIRATPITPTAIPLTASCNASPGTVRVGETVNWSVTRSGGTGSYTYSWSGAVSGTSRTPPSISYSTIGTKTANVRVTSGSESVNRTCSVNVIANQEQPSPSVILTANPTSIQSGESSYLSWTSNNANSCSASWTTSTAPAGDKIVYPTVTTTYEITCYGASGTTTATASRKDSIGNNNTGDGPDVTTRSATSVDRDEATLRGDVDGNGLATRVWFEWSDDR